MDVQGTAVTHTPAGTQSPKNSINVSWTAPMTNAGAVTFRYVAMLGLAYFGVVWFGFAWPDSLAGLDLIWLDNLSWLVPARHFA